MKVFDSTELVTDDGSHSVGWIRRRVASQLALAGVEIDGSRPFDPRVRRERALTRILMRGTLGAGDSYVDGDWECESLDTLTARLVFASLAESRSALSWASPVEFIARVSNRQTRRQAVRNGMAHYDRGNELYTAMLGPSMAYSCGYWREAQNLNAAQEAKYDLACKKLTRYEGARHWLRVGRTRTLRRGAL